MAEQQTLLNFAPMIDSEFSRFVLTHYGVPFVEARHIFPIVSVIAYFRNGSRNVPLYTGNGIKVVGPRPIVEHYETVCGADKKLIPADPAEKAQFETDFAKFNGDLGHLTAVLGYYYLLPHKDIMIEPFTRGVPGFEAFTMRISYSLVAALFTSLLKLSADSAAQAFKDVKVIFDDVDKRIADGRQYLIGGKLSLADLALATAAAPLLLPPNYGSPMPAFETMPQDLRTIMTELRSHPAARFVNEIYRKHRLPGSLSHVRNFQPT